MRKFIITSIFILQIFGLKPKIADSVMMDYDSRQLFFYVVIVPQCARSIVEYSVNDLISITCLV